MRQLIIASVLLTYLATCATFDEFKAEMESKVSALASEMESIFARRC